MTNPKEYPHADITGAIIHAGRAVHAELRGARMDVRRLQEMLRIELLPMGRKVRINYRVPMMYKGQIIDKDEIIHLIIDGTVGVCIVRGKTVTDTQRDKHRPRIRGANLAVGLVISFDGPSLQWRRIDNEHHQQAPADGADSA